MDKIMVGDIVKINPEQAGKSYSSYEGWFSFYHVKSEKFEPDLPLLSEHINAYNEDYIVKWIAPHLRRDDMLYAIQGVDTERVFLVSRQAIKGYYHTEQSSDCCYDINERLLVQEILRLEDEIDILKQERDKKKEIEMEVKPKSIPMPPLENGMFGLQKIYNFSEDCVQEHWFVVVFKDNICHLIHEDGGYSLYENKERVPFYYNTNGICKDEEGEILGEIVYLCNACNFTNAKTIYKELRKYFEIWSKD